MSEAATPAPPAPAPTLDSMNASERAQWRLTGEFPAAPSPTPAVTPSTEADSSPDAPDVQATSTDVSASPASEPGTPKKPANADTRKAELNAEIKALLAQRDALKADLSSPRDRPAVSDVPPAASSPATQPPSLEAFIATPDISKPVLTDTEFFGQFGDANLSDYIRYAAQHQMARAHAVQSLESSRQTRAASFTSQLDAKKAADPGFWPKVEPIASQLVPVDRLGPNARPTSLNVAAQEILMSPQAPDILEHLADHPEVLNSLRTGTTRDAIRTIAMVEARLTATPVPASTPVVKTTTSAPPPPDTLGRKPTAPVDEVTAAIQANDVRRYREAMNRREMVS